MGKAYKCVNLHVLCIRLRRALGRSTQAHATVGGCCETSQPASQSSELCWPSYDRAPHDGNAVSGMPRGHLLGVAHALRC
eukprot:2649351-Amphidinium_carterae.1